MKQRQFTLFDLLREVTLLAVAFGLFRWIAIGIDTPGTSHAALVLAVPTAFAFLGAAIGGLAKRSVAGALSGLTVFFLAIFLKMFLGQGLS